MATFHLRVIFLISMFFTSSYSLSDSESLLKFKASLVNASNLDSWRNNPKPPCDGNRANWVGVLCKKDTVLGLKLEKMGLSGTIGVDSLSGFSKLRTLSFMNNNFNGSLPDFNKLSGLRSLYLSNNQFSGDLPKNAFESLARLKKLYLSKNKFTGEIPSSIANLRKVIEIKLDGNKFSGKIPDFKQHNFTLNLSNNALEGSIPASLSKMDPTIFSGNKGLCGAPLKTCDSPPSPPTTQSSVPSPALPTTPSPTPSPAPPKTPAIWLPTILFLVVTSIIFATLTLLLICCRSRVQPPHSIEAPPPTSGASQKNDVELSFLRDDRERFDLAELLKSTADVLGSGSFGSSHKAALSVGSSMVVKRHKKMNNVGKEEFIKHMENLGWLRHENVLPLVAYCYRREEKLLVSDFVENGSLAVHLHGHQTLRKAPLDWPTRLNIVKGVTKGLEYLYNELPALISPHGHLKSSNVLLNECLQPLLTDYSLIPLINPESAQELIVAYKSPEYIKHGRITKKTDVWCLGVLILEILTGKFPANFLQNGKGTEEQDLAVWVTSIVGDYENNNPEIMLRIEEVLDKDMGAVNNGDKEMMVELLKIGLNCCESDLEKRLDLKDVVERIDGLMKGKKAHDDVLSHATNN
ncbi:hypothetical protein CXB51_021089 [Gossypium anomalum]|uniref:Protein kinase domain-containing protein n=1 Tax=Gossypium anomalum TaxID=47600 RepID=A0A8J6CUE5_9ROSI|nr:hypothetical protein CXB51_021089 [Gossypium anomalum]